MLSYCWKCREKTDCKNRRVVKAKNGRIMISSNCAACVDKKWKFIKEQEANELLSSLGIRSSLYKIPFVGPIFFHKN